MDKMLNFVAIDLETTGFGPKNEKIIELSAIRYCDGICCDTYSQLINPQMPVPDSVSRLTGITSDMLYFMPTIGEALPEFLAFIGQDTLVGHNITFDLGFLRAACSIQNHEITNDYVDTMNLARKMLPALNNHKLCTVSAYFGHGDGTAHRALEDAEQSASCYLSLQECTPPIKAESSKVRMIDEWDGKKQKKKPRQFYDGVSAKSVMENTIVASIRDADFDGKTFVVTGSLSHMARGEAYKKIVAGGGIVKDSVSKAVDYLIDADGIVSTKVKRAIELQSKGHHIIILSEAQFLRMLESPDAIDLDATEDKPDTTVGICALQQIAENTYKKMCDALLYLDCGYDLSKIQLIARQPDTDKAYFTIEILGKSCVRIKKNKENVVAFTPRCKPMLELLPHNCILNQNPRDNWIEIDDAVLSFRNAELQMGNIYELFCEGDRFDCCSRFAECSDLTQCPRKDISFATLCNYRNQLRNGRIFYGKNRNIDT